MSGTVELDAHRMKISVNRIPLEGMQEEAAYDPKTLDIERSDVSLEQPLRVSAFITKAEHEVVVHARIRGVLQCSCARCLQSFESPLHAEMTMSYEASPTDVLDITDDVRQEILLAYPMIPLCGRDCKGLCPACGHNLNQEILPHKCRGKISD
ncbi:MAG: DUF177 domain-containing protein [Candidatus Omnitrophica bacterium]|nr:DUF177 domain-containing protein [Candidatus Omnitrophota bacterium]